MQILPSGQQPAPGLALAPFRGLRYAQARVSGLAEVTSPPYDVIAQDAAAKLRAADPHNVVRLILPRHDAGNPGDAYGDAAQLFHDWQEQGILLPDPQPALYVYEQALRGGQVLQQGLIGALRLTPLDAGSVLPHEDVMPGPVAGRRQLMEAAGANLEPIFLLYDGDGADGAASRLVAQVAGSRPPLMTVDTDDGIRHRLWALTDPAEQAAVATDLASRQALIADGHHRYAAYLQLQARKRANGQDGPGRPAHLAPWDAGLALLVDSQSFPPHIGAIHRMIPGLSAPEAAQRARAAFAVRPLPEPLGTTPTASWTCCARPAAWRSWSPAAGRHTCSPIPIRGRPRRRCRTARPAGAGCPLRSCRSCCSLTCGGSRTTRAASRCITMRRGRCGPRQASRRDRGALPAARGGGRLRGRRAR